jgi:phosphatidylinositol-3-phosphatase
MENHSYSSVMGSGDAPYITGLAHRCLNVVHAHAISHPSGPNYVGATSGIPLSRLPHTDCTNCRQSGPSLFSQRISWRSYQESMATNCQLSGSGSYVPRHNAATYFTAARKRCAANDVPFSRMALQLKRHGLPQFTFITPNLQHDMHNGSVAAGDRWLHKHLPPILHRREYRNGSTLVFLMWDEGNGAGDRKGADCAKSSLASCHVPLVVLGAHIRHRVYTGKVDHYDGLATTEKLLGVHLLGSGSPMRLRLRRR